jgi:hypothetical protein
MLSLNFCFTRFTEVYRKNQQVVPFKLGNVAETLFFNCAVAIELW